MRDMLKNRTNPPFPHIGIVQFIKALYINILQTSGQIPSYEISYDFPTHTCLDNLSFLHDIVYPNEIELKEFIKNHQEHLHLILYACHVTTRTFEKSAQLSLEVEKDPETSHQMLFLTVRQEKYSMDIQDKIRTIRKKYRCTGLTDTLDFIVTTDYQPPLKTYGF
jgi:hypothetical protein